MNLNSTFIIQCLVFFALALFTMKFIWPPLMGALDERRKKIADGLAAADQGNKSLEEARKRISVLENEARTQAQQIITDTEKRAQAIVDAAKATAKAEGARLLEAAKAEIDNELQRVKDTLRDQVATLAVLGAEQILKKEINAQAHADLLNQLKARL